MSNDMISDYREENFDEVLTVINDAATAYKGVIPTDCWHEPYMSAADLKHEINAGVSFKVLCDVENTIVGVMGAQPVKDVLLIRHAYVDPAAQRQGIGAALLTSCEELAERPLLIGTWAAADWAIGFYEKHGFQRTSPADKDRLLRSYWTIPERQIETSVVLVDARWFEANTG